jgi:mannose-6-phosphate isomerase-like protein (cupin superfamily)
MASPANISVKEDPLKRPFGIAPAPNGSIFRIVDFPPLPPENELSPDLMRSLVGGGHAPHGAKPSRHPMMHRTRSLDYAIVLSGEIDMLLDDSVVHVKAGDVIIQQGTNHGWVNRGSGTCRIAFVLIDAQEPST